MSRYALHASQRFTPQSEPADPRQVPNSGGGFAFPLSPEARLDRWLILGAEGGTYYASERKLTRENAATIIDCLDRSGLATVERIAVISESGRAPKNDPAIFALSLAASHRDPATRAAALTALPRVCRTGTHLFAFAQSVQEFRGWGRSLRRAVARWYNDRTAESLAYQVAKYRQRNGMSHRDLMRLSHPTPAHAPIFRWVADPANLGERTIGTPARTYEPVGELPPLLSACDAIRTASVGDAVKLILTHKLTHEMVPSALLGNPAIWVALLQHMPLTALVRNLARMTSNGTLQPLSASVALVLSRLRDADALRHSRLHPIQLLSALRTYSQGHGERGNLRWTPIPALIEALDDAFYASFSTIEPSGAATLLALDVSGSMDSGSIAGCPGLTPRLAAACMAMATIRVEPNWHALGFSHALVDIPLHSRMSLTDVVSVMESIPMGATNCALPMTAALSNRWPVDVFAVYTDNETNTGALHPHQALVNYRRGMSRPRAKLAVTAFTASDFSIAPPDDGGCMNLVGFDGNAPSILADFSRVS